MMFAPVEPFNHHNHSATPRGEKSMHVDLIEQAKRDYTDQYVALVDNESVALPSKWARFVGLTGQVKTVNMSGQALVEWLDYHKNIGWYDIDLEYLQVVEKPPEPEPPLKKPPAKKPSPAKAKPTAAKPQAEGKKLSPLEILRQQSKKKAGDD